LVRQSSARSIYEGAIVIEPERTKRQRPSQIAGHGRSSRLRRAEQVEERGLLVDAAILLTALPAIASIVKIALIARGNIDVLIVLLRGTNLLAFFGSSVVQLSTLVAFFMLGWVAVISTSAKGRAYVGTILGRHPWVLLAAYFGALVFILTAPWLMVLMVIIVPIVPAVLIAAMYLALWLIRKFFRFSAMLARVAHNGLAHQARNADNRIWRSVAEFLSRHRVPPKPIRRKGLGWLTEDFVAAMAKERRKVAGSPRRIIGVGLMSCVIVLIIMPTAWGPVERISVSGSGSIVGYVAESTGDWTTVVTDARRIAIVDTSRVASRDVCPTVHVAIPVMLYQYGSVAEVLPVVIRAVTSWDDLDMAECPPETE
jgi:hypothetical protein